MGNFKDIYSFIISALPYAVGVIIGEIVIKIWEKYHDNRSKKKSE